MPKALRVSLLVIVVLLIAIQFIPVARTNPPGEAEIDAPAAVMGVLRTSCYDCHSNETRWPWYSRVAPMSWLVAHDVTEGREHLNFSAWGRMRPAKRAKLIAEIWEEVEEGKMPLPVYLLAHRDARLGEAERQVLRDWATASGNDGDGAAQNAGGGSSDDPAESDPDHQAHQDREHESGENHHR